MLTIHPARLLFMLSLLTGTFIAFSSSSWFTAWLGLELNLLSFIPLITSKSNLYSSEAALKYFLIQALGSALILAAAPSLLVISIEPKTVILSALLLKMGAAPVHFWFPSVMQGIGWPQCIILMTIQKVAPMLMLSYLLSNESSYDMLLCSSISSALIGSLGGLNQTLIRKIMAYSSINHMAWMLAAITIKTPLWVNYFVIYSVISSSVVAIMHSQQIFHYSQMLSLNQSPFLKVTMSFSLLSLGGLPPFLGFIPKLTIIQSLVFSGSIAWLGFLLFSALITLFFYLRLIMVSFTMSSLKPKNSILLRLSGSMLISITFINLVPLLSPLVTFNPF